MKYYVVIDTNVIVSALLKENSNPNKIVKLVFSSVIVPIFSESILREYREVLKRPKFDFPEELVDKFIARLEKYGRKVEPEPLEISQFELPDPGDWKFYELLLRYRRAEMTYLVTGNIRHFPHERFIVTPRLMCEIVALNS